MATKKKPTKTSLKSTTPAAQDLKNPRNCDSCGTKITKIKDLRTVVALRPRNTSRGGLSMTSRKETRCPSC